MKPCGGTSSSPAPATGGDTLARGRRNQRPVRGGQRSTGQPVSRQRIQAQTAPPQRNSSGTSNTSVDPNVTSANGPIRLTAIDHGPADADAVGDHADGQLQDDIADEDDRDKQQGELFGIAQQLAPDRQEGEGNRVRHSGKNDGHEQHGHGEDPAEEFRVGALPNGV